jgi:hypothetical protein
MTALEANRRVSRSHSISVIFPRMSEEAARATTVPQRIGRALGLLLMLVVGWFYVVSGLVAPLWAVIGLLIVWGVVLIIGLREWNTRPFWILAAPFALMVFWAVVIWAGGQFLGWSA